MIQFEKAFIINCGVISIRPLYCRNETGTRGGELRSKRCHSHTAGAACLDAYKHRYGRRKSRPANGLLLETSKGIVLIDTPWNDSLTEQLMTQIKQRFPGKRMTDAIVTHAHDDRIGGLNTLYKYGVKVHSTKLTADFARQQGYDRPLGDMKNVTKLQFGDMKIETFYPGKGHTEDNITVWLPEDKLLFGGCLIKALETKEIIPTPGFYPDQWPRAVRKVMKRYQDISIVVPGHGSPGMTVCCRIR